MTRYCSGIQALNRSLHNPVRYLIIAQVPALRIPYMNTFIGGPYVLFLRIIGIMRYLTGLCKDLFNGKTPDQIIDKYARTKSVSEPKFLIKKL